MGGQVDSKKVADIRRIPWESNREQVVATGKQKRREETQGGIPGAIYQFFVQSGFVRTKNPGPVGLIVVNGCAICGGEREPGRRHTARRSTQRRYCPDFVAAERPSVV